MTDELPEKLRLYMANQGIPDDSFSADEFTCNSCIEKGSCEFAWDLYNLDGDCLASK